MCPSYFTSMLHSRGAEASELLGDKEPALLYILFVLVLGELGSDHNAVGIGHEEVGVRSAGNAGLQGVRVWGWSS